MFVFVPGHWSTVMLEGQIKFLPFYLYAVLPPKGKMHDIFTGIELCVCFWLFLFIYQGISVLWFIVSFSTSSHLG